MLRNSLFTLAFIFLLTASDFAQETRPTPRPSPTQATAPRPDSTHSRPPTSTTTAPPQATSNSDDGTTQYARTGSRNMTPAERAVRAAFERLLDGIRQADVDGVMSVYLNSTQLTLFNNNGTVTRGAAQVRANRESSYPNYTDVTLDVRDARVYVLSPSSAVITCLWTQSQSFRGTPETASGRLTLVFQLTGGQWRAVHTHTSPDAPDSSRVLPSERTTAPTTPPPDDPR